MQPHTQKCTHAAKNILRFIINPHHMLYYSDNKNNNKQQEAHRSGGENLDAKHQLYHHICTQSYFKFFASKSRKQNRLSEFKSTSHLTYYNSEMAAER